MCESAAALAVQLYTGVVRTGGATLTLVQCDHGSTAFKISSGAQPGGGFMVALAEGPTATASMDTWSVMAAYQSLNELVDRIEVARFLLLNPFAGIGFWVDPSTNLLVLDAVEMYQDRTVALTLASARGQKAIYDLALGQDVLVP